MSAFTHLPLGQRIPPSLHGVSCSLPTMHAVIGYEEKNPEVTKHLTSGYPRFVVHPFAKQAGAHLLRTQPALAGHSLWLTSSRRAAERLRNHLASPDVRLLEDGPLTGVAFPENAELASRAKTFLQHTGMFLSSREAEDYLIRVGELSAAYPEQSFEGYAAGNTRYEASNAAPTAESGSPSMDSVVRRSRSSRATNSPIASEGSQARLAAATRSASGRPAQARARSIVDEGSPRTRSRPRSRVNSSTASSARPSAASERPRLR